MDYVQGASPPDLPGGEMRVPPFEVTQGFLAESTSPPFVSGVGPGEQVAIVFDLMAGGTLQDVLDELTNQTRSPHEIQSIIPAEGAFTSLHERPQYGHVLEPAAGMILRFSPIARCAAHQREHATPMVAQHGAAQTTMTPRIHYADSCSTC